MERIVGDALGIAIVVSILVLAAVTSVLAMRATNHKVTSSGRSELVAAVATILVGLLMLPGGWLVLDVVWLLTRAPRMVTNRLGPGGRP